MSAFQYYSIIVIFAFGAGIGGVLSRHMDIVAIRVSCGLLLGAGLYLNKEHV